HALQPPARSLWRRDRLVGVHLSQALKAALISANGTARPRFVNVPCSAISLAAVRNPAHAERASAPPTLIRRTPTSASSRTLKMSLPTSTLTGFGATASTMLITSPLERSPG